MANSASTASSVASLVARTSRSPSVKALYRTCTEESGSSGAPDRQLAGSTVDGGDVVVVVGAVVVVASWWWWLDVVVVSWSSRTCSSWPWSTVPSSSLRSSTARPTSEHDGREQPGEDPPARVARDVPAAGAVAARSAADHRLRRAWPCVRSVTGTSTRVASPSRVVIGHERPSPSGTRRQSTLLRMVEADRPASVGCERCPRPARCDRGDLRQLCRSGGPLSVLTRGAHVLAGHHLDRACSTSSTSCRRPAYAELTDGARSEALRKLTFRALWWFR